MTRTRVNLISWLWVLAVTLWATTAQAQEFRYRYVSLDGIVPPAPFTFFRPASLHDSGRVYGTVCTELCSDARIAYYQDGTVTVLGPSGFAGSVVNAGGTVGGGVLIDPENFIFQAALFHRGKAEVIPKQPGEIDVNIISLNDRNMALVESATELELRYFLYSNGQASLLSFGPTVTAPRFLSKKHINNEGIIAGRTGEAFNGARGFRFNPRTGRAELLDPFPGDPTETLAWGMGINNRGDVLGYSFTTGVRPYHERIGVWDSTGRFRTYSVSPISTNRLLFNDNNLIVVTFVLSTRTSYLIPRPGVRFDLADLVVNLPEGAELFMISDLNNRGDMLGGSSFAGGFLLQRIDTMAPQVVAASRPSSTVKSMRHNMPPKAAAMLRNLLPSIEDLK